MTQWGGIAVTSVPADKMEYLGHQVTLVMIQRTPADAQGQKHKLLYTKAWFVLLVQIGAVLTPNFPLFPLIHVQS